MYFFIININHKHMNIIIIITVFRKKKYMIISINISQLFVHYTNYES